MATSQPNEQPIHEPAVFGVGFLLSTLGFRSHTVWAERLAPFGLDARQAAMLLQIARAEGRSQQALARALKIPPSRVVALVDELERRHLLRRRGDRTDRRVRTLHLTPEGRTMVQRLAELSVEHESWLCGARGAGMRATRRTSEEGRRRAGAVRHGACGPRRWRVEAGLTPKGA
jgi:DNA-binding MarR family transcriptional regulator